MAAECEHDWIETTTPHEWVCSKCWAHPEVDEMATEVKRLRARVEELETAIREHRDGIGDRDFCTPVMTHDDPLDRVLPSRSRS